MQKQREGERLVTVAEAEKLTGRKASTWRKDMVTRRIAFVRLGRSVRIPISEIERLIEEGWRERVPPNGGPSA